MTARQPPVRSFRLAVTIDISRGDTDIVLIRQIFRDDMARPGPILVPDNRPAIGQRNIGLAVTNWRSVSNDHLAVDRFGTKCGQQ